MMQYAVIVRDRRTGDTEWLREGLLDGLIPDGVVALTTCESAEAMGICMECEAASHCHVLVPVAGRPHAYTKHCPILWHDLFHPEAWRVEDLA